MLNALKRQATQMNALLSADTQTYGLPPIFHELNTNFYNIRFTPLERRQERAAVHMDDRHVATICHMNTMTKRTSYWHIDFTDSVRMLSVVTQKSLYGTEARKFKTFRLAAEYVANYLHLLQPLTPDRLRCACESVRYTVDNKINNTGVDMVGDPAIERMIEKEYVSNSDLLPELQEDELDTQAQMQIATFLLLCLADMAEERMLPEVRNYGE